MSEAALDRHKVAAARLWATSRMPYLASALFACSVRASPGSNTIGVDRAWHVQADPDVLSQMEVDELGRLLIHLTGHLIRDHAARAARLSVSEDAPRARWNRACDAEINDDLAEDDCVPTVAPDLPQTLGAAPGGLAESYYDSARDGPRHWDCGSGADGHPRPCDHDDGISREQSELLRIGVAQDIKRHHDREPGTVAGGWLRWAEAVLPSRIDWRRVLAAEIRSALAAIAGKVDYSYRRPSRRAHLTPDVVTPTLHQPVPQVAIVVDTSGSMHEELLARALAEVESILVRAGLRQTAVRILAVDTEVQAVARARRAADVKLAGGGGTDMGHGIHAAAQLRPKPSLVIVLTDGFTPWPDEPPPGVRVIVGLLVDDGFPEGWEPPAWARTIEIKEVE